MNQNRFETVIGRNDTGLFVGEDECRIQFNHKEMSAFHFSQTFSNAIAESFLNYCRMTIASGSIPSCFRQDMSKDEIEKLQEDLEDFRDNFADALFNLSLIFEI